MEKDLKETVAINLRSIVQSVKNGIPINRLEKDYKDFIGENIPFRKLGYKSVEDYICNIPDVINISKVDGQLRAYAVANADTAHIERLVNNQRDVRRPRRRPFMYKRGGYRGSSGYKGKNFIPDYKPPITHTSIASKKSCPPKLLQPDFQSSNQKSYGKSAHSSKSYPTKPKYIAPRFQRKQENLNLSTNDSSSNEDTYQSDSSLFANPPIEPPLLRDTDDDFDQMLYQTHASQPRPLKENISQRDTFKKKLADTKSAVEYIDVYAKENNLVVKYVTTQLGQKKKEYISMLTLGEKKYRSFPTSAASKKSAEELVASLAVKEIKESEDLSSFSETPITTVENVRILLNRIEEIVCEKPSGMFTNGIIKEYEKVYHESLPPSWLDLLKGSSCVQIDEVGISYGRVPEGVKYIVRPLKAMSSGQSTPSSSSSKADLLLEDFAKLHHNSKSYGYREAAKEAIPPPKASTFSVPNELKIPDGNEWAVHITSVSDVIAARLVEYDEAFLDMLNRMSEYYLTHEAPVTNVCIGKSYALSDNSLQPIVHRVVACNLLENDEVEIYYPDEGVNGTTLKMNLQELDQTFCSLPYQAIYLILHGLEDFDPFVKQDDWNALLGRTFVADIKKWIPPTQGFFPDNSGLHSNIYSVILYDTEGSEDVDMNEIMKHNVLNSLSWKLPKLNTSTHGYLTHVSESGEIYIRFLHPGESPLEEILEKYSPIFDEVCISTEFSAVQNNIFVAKFRNGKWYRAVVDDNAPQSAESINVFYIDYGNTSIVPMSDICELTQYSEFLSCLSHQAIKCELHNVLQNSSCKWTKATTNELLKLAPFGEKLLIRVMSEMEGGKVAKVNLHKRIYHNKDDSLLVSINDNLSCLFDLYVENGFVSKVSPTVPSSLNLHDSGMKQHQNANLGEKRDKYQPSESIHAIEWLETPDNVKSPEAYEGKASTFLKLPLIPKEGDIFEVFVTMAAHPGNFVVQSLKSANEMDVLMHEMMSFYSCEDNCIEMPVSLLKENEYYAALHFDSIWYRVRLENVLPADSYSAVCATVYFVDFGDYREVNVQNLQMLFEGFRTLPCQAIKASLYGVKPIANDWDPNHCIAFRDLVTQKSFASLIKKKTCIDKSFFSYYELELILIDTSLPEKDIFIHECLINDGVAVSL